MVLFDFEYTFTSIRPRHLLLTQNSHCYSCHCHCFHIFCCWLPCHQAVTCRGALTVSPVVFLWSFVQCATQSLEKCAVFCVWHCSGMTSPELLASLSLFVTTFVVTHHAGHVCLLWSFHHGFCSQPCWSCSQCWSGGAAVSICHQ